MSTWILAFHIICMVAWFAGLFYLPRLFVYHRLSTDLISINRFKIMEKKLYYYITTPAAVLTSIFGIWLLTLDWDYYKLQGWMQLKLGLVVLLWIFHFSCGYLLKQFAQDKISLNACFFRCFNEIPTLLLIGIIILVIVKPNII